MNSFSDFMPIFILMALGCAIVLGAWFVSFLISKKEVNEYKMTPYECGELPVGSAWSSFNVRFYVTGLIFIIFDVESALMFPVAAVFKKFSSVGLGFIVFLEIFLFILIIAVGLGYCWKKGDLDWVKSFQRSIK